LFRGIAAAAAAMMPHRRNIGYETDRKSFNRHLHLVTARRSTSEVAGAVVEPGAVLVRPKNGTPQIKQCFAAQQI
jgi:hypothetical protein